MSEPTPAIDVLIPVYNAAETLDCALESVAAQTFTDFRVLAVDDGSTDASADILARWSAKDARFTVIAQANGGIVNALNRALSESSAPVIARMDSDDLCDPRRFERQWGYLKAHEDTVALGGRIEHMDGDGQPLPGFAQPGDPQNADFDAVPALEPYIVHPFLMARADAVKAVGGYRYMPHSEDSDLYWRLSERGRLHNLDATLGRYRFHTDSISGGSIVNGRIMAVGCQLAAMAARIRARGDQDAGFAANVVPQLKQAGSLDAMCELMCDYVAPRDHARFRLCAAIKLLDMAAYRPYEIEREDCEFVAAQARAAGDVGLAQDTLAVIKWHISESAARLLRQGRFADAAALAPASVWPAAMAKAVLR